MTNTNHPSLTGQAYWRKKSPEIMSRRPGEWVVESGEGIRGILVLGAKMRNPGREQTYRRAIALLFLRSVNTHGGKIAV